MPNSKPFARATLSRDLTAGLVVFLVALPLCLGVAMASGAPLISGIVAGVVGGILVGALSGSHTSVSGPAAGLTAIVASQIAGLKSFEAFLFALMIAGLIQIALGVARAGFIAAFFPSSVIKGLLAAIGVILILKQIPHLVGHDADPEGEMAFFQPDQRNTFTEFIDTVADLHPGAAFIGLISVAILIFWDKNKLLKKSPIPAPLVVVVLGTIASEFFQSFGVPWLIGPTHLVDVPPSDTLTDLFRSLRRPDFLQWTNPAIYLAGLTIAIVASLETLLNLEAVDKIDPWQRNSPPSRELWAQGVGNLAAGFLGGIPVTSVIIRSSVNINAGAATKVSTMFHGVLLLVFVVFFPVLLNQIPLSCLAAILLVTGLKLASPKLFTQMWNDGRYQFVPFLVTVVAIVFTDLLKGIGIGMAVALSFILNSNLRRPVRRFVERHLGGDVLHIELANQVSFLNRAALSKTLDEVPRGGHVLLDALETDYIDPDVLDLIREYREQTAPARDVEVSLIGFRQKYQLEDQIQYVDYSTRELQASITPQQVLQLLKDGNERFRTGKRLTRDLGRTVLNTARGQHPLAAVLSCIDSRSPAELIFDLALGDIFSVRIAGNVISRKVLGSLEYSCAVAGARLILVVGHTRCGAVTTAVQLACSQEAAAQATGCQHVEFIVEEIHKSIDADRCRHMGAMTTEQQEAFIDETATRNVNAAVELIARESQTLSALVRQGKICIVGAMYDVATGEIKILEGGC